MQQDNNSTTDLSSLSYGIEQANESSDNFLKVDAGGIIGFFERMPLWLKLLFITVLATLIILFFAIWLFGIRGNQTVTMLNTRKWVNQFQIAVNLADALQRERSAAVLFSIMPTATNLQNLRKLTIDTDTNWSSFKENAWYESGSPIEKQISLLRQIRDDVEKQQKDGLFIHKFYTTVIAITKKHISHESKLPENQAIISTPYLFLELINVNGLLLSYGTLAFANTNTSLSSSFYTTFTSLTVTRDTLIDVWMHMASADQVSLFNQTVLLSPRYATAMAVENAALMGGSSSFFMSTGVDAWNEKMTAVNQAYTEMLTLLLEEAHSTSLVKQIQSSTQLIIIGILAIISVALYALISFCFSKTIIGPWIRMNKLQESVTYKFVPRGLLRMVGCDNIMQVQVGKYSTKQVTLMKVAIRDYWQQTESLTVENRILYTNRFFDAINPVLVSHNGYIDTMKPDELQVCFKNPGAAVTCANKIHNLMKTLNMSDFAPLNLTIAIHAAPSADLAIIGDQDRIQSVVISKLQREMRKIMYIAKKFQCRTVVSNNVLEMLKEQIVGAQLIAMIDGKSPFVLYEISSKMKKNDIEQFSKAVRDVFVDHNIMDALTFFKTNENEAAKFYTKICEQELEQYKAQITNLTVEDILNEPALEEIVNQTCHKEQSTENLEIYKSIKRFKEAHSFSNYVDQWECVLSIKNRMEQANITDTLKQSLLSQLTDKESWEENMFKGLEGEVLLLLTDTTKRLKLSEAFRRTYIKSQGIKSDLLHERFGD